MKATSQGNNMVSNLAEEIKSKTGLETRNSQEIVVQQVCKKLFLSKVSWREGNLVEFLDPEVNGEMATDCIGLCLRT